jgi:hypothetical protein
VDQALGHLFDTGEPITYDSVLSLVRSNDNYTTVKDIQINEVDIRAYDRLLQEGVVV